MSNMPRNLNDIKFELANIRDGCEMDERSYNNIDLALDNLEEVDVDDIECGCNEVISPISTYILDLVNSAILGRDLPNLEESEKIELVDFILNDDQVWADFDFQIAEIIYQFNNSGIGSIRNEEYVPQKTLTNPVKYF